MTARTAVEIGMNVAVMTPGRTSSGGSAFSENLVPHLNRILREPVHEGTVPPLGRIVLDRAAQEASHVVFIGSRVARLAMGQKVFWPLNVAPLERHVNHLPHTSSRNRARHILLRARLGRAVSASNALVFGSLHARSLYMANYAAAARLPYAVVRGGTASFDVSASGRHEDLPASRLVLVVSHLYPYKGILELVDAIATIDRQLPPDVMVRVAGADRDRRYAAAVHGRVSELGLKNRIKIAPADSMEMRSLYATAELAVFPSTCENAGSFALYDGLHSGCPTLCSDRSSMPEMVESAVQMINPYDRVGFGLAIKTILENPQLQRDLRARASSWSLSAPTWADRADQLVDFLGELGRRT